MTIRLRAVKSNVTNGEIVQQAIELIFPGDLKEARNALAARAIGTP